MPTPTLILAIILATLHGAVFHFIIGGSFRRLVFILLVSWAGFGVGHIIGVLFGINALTVGTLRLLSASLGAVAALAAVWILTKSVR